MRARVALDVRSIAEGMSYPGIDPRSWIAIGTVDDADSVVFDEKLGPLVSVTLQPNKEPCVCRVAGEIAGDGEASYFPFVAGDEVLVAIPEGSTRASAVIVGRLNNGIDKWPSGSIAGQDPESNTFAFKRHKPPFIHELDSSYLIRQSSSTAFISINKTGTITLKEGEGSALQITPDLIGAQSKDGACILQLDTTNKIATMQAGSARLSLSNSGSSDLIAPNTLRIASGDVAAEHVLTIEGLCNLLNSIGIQALTASPGPLTGATLAVFFQTVLPLAIPAAAALPQTPTVAAAIITGLTAQLPKAPPVPGLGQQTPGIACKGLIVG